MIKFRPELEQLSDRITPKTVTVDNPLDAPVVGKVNLRQAINDVNDSVNAGGVDKIVFATAAYTDGNFEVVLNSALPVITDGVEIDGFELNRNRPIIRVAAGGQFRVLDIAMSQAKLGHDVNLIGLQI